jgi:hypothetical protein
MVLLLNCFKLISEKNYSQVGFAFFYRNLYVGFTHLSKLDLISFSAKSIAGHFIDNRSQEMIEKRGQ